jgi:hypothetical protein
VIALWVLTGDLNCASWSRHDFLIGMKHYIKASKLGQCPLFKG